MGVRTLVFLIAGVTLLSLPVMSAEFGKIDECESTPLCVVSQNSSAQPTLVEPSSEETKHRFDGVRENTSASWSIKATGPRRFVNVTVLAQVPSNPFVQDKRGVEHKKEILIKGIIPEEDTVGNPFFMADNFANPQVLPGDSNEFNGGESFRFDSFVNVSNAEQEAEFTAFMFANSTNRFVDQKRSNEATIKIQGPVTNNPPNRPRLNGPGNNTLFTDTSTVTLNVSVSDPDADPLEVTFNRDGSTEEVIPEVENGSDVSVTLDNSQGEHFWNAVADDGKKTNTSFEYRYVVDSTAPDIVFPDEPVLTYPETFDGVDIRAEDARTDDFIFSINDTERFSINQLGNLTADSELPAGEFTVAVTVEDDEGQVRTGDFTIIKQKASPSTSVSASATTYPSNVDVSASGSVSGGASDVEFELFRDGSRIDSGTLITRDLDISAGSHVFEYNTSGGQNYSSSSASDQVFLEKASSKTDLFFSNNRISVQNQNLSLNEGASLNVTGAVNISRENQVRESNMVLEAGSQEIGTVEDGNRTALNFQPTESVTVDAVFQGNENYTDSNQSQNISINQKPSIENITVLRDRRNRTFVEADLFDDKDKIVSVTGIPFEPTVLTNETLKFNTTASDIDSTLRVEDASSLESPPIDLDFNISSTDVVQSGFAESNFSRQFVEVNVTLQNDGSRQLDFNASIDNFGQVEDAGITDVEEVSPSSSLTDRKVFSKDTISFNQSDLKTNTESTAVGVRFPSFKNISVQNNGSDLYANLNTSSIRPNRCIQLNSTEIRVEPDSTERTAIAYGCQAAEYDTPLFYEAQQKPFKHKLTRDIVVFRNLTGLVWKIDLDELPQYDDRVNSSVVFGSDSIDTDITVADGISEIPLGKVDTGESEAAYNYSVSASGKVVRQLVSSTGLVASADSLDVKQPVPLLSGTQVEKSSKLVVKNSLDRSNTVQYGLGEGCDPYSIQKKQYSSVYGDSGVVSLPAKGSVELDVERRNVSESNFEVFDTCEVSLKASRGAGDQFVYRSSPLILLLAGPLGAVVALFSVWRLGIRRIIKVGSGVLILLVSGLYNRWVAVSLLGVFAVIRIISWMENREGE